MFSIVMNSKLILQSIITPNDANNTVQFEDMKGNEQQLKRNKVTVEIN